MAEFLAMGGYAAFVWGAYGVATVILVGMVVATIQRHRKLRRTLAAIEAVHGARRRRAPTAAEGDAA